MLLNTKQKISIARVANRLVLALRKLRGLPAVDEVTRGDIRWKLDLNEGIDFSIYLLGSFEPDTVKFYRSQIKPGDTVLE